jgi:hypothetical protein
MGTTIRNLAHSKSHRDRLGYSRLVKLCVFTDAERATGFEIDFHPLHFNLIVKLSLRVTQCPPY